MAGKGDYPWINLNDFTNFARVANFMDKDVHQSDLDRLFIASNVEKRDVDN